MSGSTETTRGQWTTVAIAAFALLAFSFLLGGASRLNELRLAVVELSALPLLVVAAFAMIQRNEMGRHPFAFALLAAVAALPLFQLIPLPPAVWTALPGRQEPALGLELAAVTPGWAPLSLAPDRTWQSFLALIPPVAMFLGVLAMAGENRRRLVLLLLAATLVSIALGCAQLASGGEALYPWPTTGAGAVTGFFANRNHLATLCLASLPFAAALGGASLRRSGRQSNLWVMTIFIALVVIAIGVIRSRAGILLVWPVIGGSLLITWVAAGRGRPSTGLLLVGGAVLAALIAIGVFGLDPILARFDAASDREGRFENWPIVAQAANTYLPVGSGFGSFDTVYRSVEPLGRLDSTFFNQAHNDYLETWLEAGWFGAAALIAFLVWFARRSWSAWRGRPSTARDLQRAASVAIGAILLHSAADYPLRTVTMAVVFALCCALLELAGQPDAETHARTAY